MESVSCFQCNVPAMVVEEPHTRFVGGRQVTFLDRFYRCAECGEAFYVGEMADESLRRATAVIRAEDGLLSPDEIIAVRRTYGLTQAAMERLIGAGKKTLVRWERGTIPQNRTADTLLRVLAANPAAAEWLAAERGVRLKPARRAA